MILAEKKSKSLLFKIILWMFPVLFLTDDILGFNGYQFTIAGKSIRIILFVISMAVLCLYSLYIILKEKMLLPNRENGEEKLLKLIRPIDCAVLAFVLGNAVWATVVPLLVRGEMKFSLKDFSCILVLALYFPIAFLIRTGRLNFKIIENITYILTIILAIWHCVMYIGETISPGFYASYYDFIDIISFGTAVRSSVVFGYGIVRIIQTTSLFLLLGAFLSLKKFLKKGWLHLLPLLIFTFALCITYTKSIWFGYVAGLFLFLVAGVILNKDKKMKIKSGLALIIAVLMIVVLNFAVLNNTVFERTFNTVRSEQSVEEMQKLMEELANAGEDITELQNKIKDALGTQEANSLRAAQNGALLGKWSESKWVGFGYGSYVEDCIRNEQFPYMYESTLPALIMKLGLAGATLWIAFIGFATVYAIKTFWKENKSNAFLWLGIALSYAMAVQTNPFLFTFAGMSMLLYLLISLQRKHNFSEVEE